MKPRYTIEIINKGISYQVCVWAYYADDCQYSVATIGTDMIDPDKAKAVAKSEAARSILSTIKANPSIFK